MAEAKRREAWDRTSMLAYLIAESNRNPKQRSQPFTPLDFHPMRSKSDEQSEAERQQNFAEARRIMRAM